MRYKNFLNENGQSNRRLKKVRHGEMTGLLLACCLLLYAVAEKDVPVIFLTAAFILFVLQSILEKLGGVLGRRAANVLKGLSLTLFGGALLMAFF